MNRIYLAIVAVALTGVTMSTGFAAPITFNFTGTATSQTGAFVGQGLPVSGSFTYDSTAVDAPLLVGNGSVDQFLSNTPGNEALAWNITVTNGAVTRDSANNQNLFGTLHHALVYLDNPLADSISFDALRISPFDNEFTFRLLDDAQPPDGVAVGSNNLTDTPFAVTPELSLFNLAASGGSVIFRDEEDRIVDRLDFQIDSIAAAQVPEPSTMAIWATLSLSGAFAGWRRRKKLLA